MTPYELGKMDATMGYHMNPYHPDSEEWEQYEDGHTEGWLAR